MEGDGAGGEGRVEWGRGGGGVEKERSGEKGGVRGERERRKKVSSYFEDSDF